MNLVILPIPTCIYYDRVLLCFGLPFLIEQPTKRALSGLVSIRSLSFD